MNQFLKNKLNVLSIIIVFFILLTIFYRWFTPNYIIGGDWPFFYDEYVREFPALVSSWNTLEGNGLGGTAPTYFLLTFLNFTILFTTVLQIPWVIVYKVFWFGLSIFLLVFSSIYFSKTVFRRFPLWVSMSSVLIFTTNTYALLLAGGGQMGVLLSYSVAPLVLASLIKCINSALLKDNYRRESSKGHLHTDETSITTASWKGLLKLSLVAGLAVAVQVMFDPRIAYLVLLAGGVYFVTLFVTRTIPFNKLFHSIIYTFLIPGIVVVGIHATWILPSLITRQNFSQEFGATYSSLGIVKFLSFGSFSETLSLLHPNWPENIFGKVGFMKPEFLLLPIIAYLSLLFLNRSQSQPKQNVMLERVILFLLLLGLMGAFLAKGAKEPFGEIYLWLFEHVPGFILFRDSTKFYLWVALSYSIVIPYSLFAILSKISKTKKYIVFAVFLLIWTFTIRQAITGQLKGTFVSHKVPNEYFAFKNFLHAQPDYFRTFWVPKQQRFSFYSTVHPSLEAAYLFNATSSAQAVQILKQPHTQQYFEELNIKYVIVPYDSLGEIFLKDRKYNEVEYKAVMSKLKTIPWLEKKEGFGKLGVFETVRYKDHIYLSNNGKISSVMIQPYLYKVSVSIDSPQQMIFSEKYNPNWVIKFDDITISSQKTLNNLNSFLLKKTGTYNFDLYFSHHQYYDYGRIISIITLLVTVILIVLLRKKDDLLQN